MKDTLALFDRGPERYPPDPNYKRVTEADYVLDQQFLARLVGTVAIGLPLVMLFAVYVWGVCHYQSISHFYYSRFYGDVLVAALVFIGIFLWSYRGENSDENKLASIAGTCAFGIALFPTAGRGCDEASYAGRALATFELNPQTGRVAVSPAENPGHFFELFPSVDVIHLTSAVLLFAFLAYYAFYVFTRPVKERHIVGGDKLSPAKTGRNKIYRITGWIIVASIAAIGVNALYWAFTGQSLPGWNEKHVTFWFESVALVAFGVSWMVKGRFVPKSYMDEFDLKNRQRRAKAT